jgi:hypothetical protein
MAILSLLLLSIAGGVVWLFNVEAAAILYGSNGYHPVLVGLTCAVGQSIAYTLLYFGGDWLLGRWGWWRRGLERMRARWGERLKKGFLGATATAALIGLPPMTGMAAIAASFEVRYSRMIAIALSLRTLRFIILAAAGARIAAWWHGFSW